MLARRRRRSRLPLTAAGSALLSCLAIGAARADDLPLPAPLSGLGSLPAPANWLLPNYKSMAPPYVWSGFFVHPLIGYQTAEFSGAGGRLVNNASGFTLGGEGGYNFQLGRFVLGPVADLSYAWMHGSGNSWLANISRADIDWVGSARAQAGYTFDRFMIYATGGAAFADLKIDSFLGSNSRTETGWTAGGGVQYLWSDSSILHLEYRRVELQEADFYAFPLYQRRLGVAMNLFNGGFFWKF
jgi:outer membrane immunogenic protein